MRQQFIRRTSARSKPCRFLQTHDSKIEPGGCRRANRDDEVLATFDTPDTRDLFDVAIRAIEVRAIPRLDPASRSWKPS